MRAPVMAQLRKIHSECPFEYIRFHGIFHEDMNVVRMDKEVHWPRARSLFFSTLSHLRHKKERGLRRDALLLGVQILFRNVSLPEHGVNDRKYFSGDIPCGRA